MHLVQKVIRQARRYERLTHLSEIVRRYFAINAFDGVLTIIGVLVGNLAVGVDNPRIVVSTGLATCVAMGVSGIWGAYLTETAERKRALVELGRQTLSDLHNTRLGRASRVAVVTVALVNGLAPFLAALLVLLPFFMVGLFPVVLWVYLTSLGIALLTLFSLGLFLGHIAQANMALYGFKMVLAGLVCILISIFLGE